MPGEKADIAEVINSYVCLFSYLGHGNAVCELQAEYSPAGRIGEYMAEVFGGIPTVLSCVVSVLLFHCICYELEVYRAVIGNQAL